jgi:WXXGXW repeat (2 copies)
MKTLVGIIALTLLMTSCRTNYVKVRPVYAEESRPESPDYNYVWLNDNWVYNKRKHSYIKQNGYWAKPKNNRNYQQGYWKSNKNGSHWVAGRWK